MWEHTSQRIQRVTLAWAALALGIGGCTELTTVGGTDAGITTDGVPGIDLPVADPGPEADSTPPPDGGPDGWVPPLDVAPDGHDCGGEFGCPCSTNGDCLDGLCIEGVDGLFCTKSCIESCPSGFDCVNTTALGPDPMSICVPRHVRLCRPCDEDADCQSALDGQTALCREGPVPGQGSFCTSSCEGGRPCPEGYTCTPITLDGGAEVQQCVPTDGQCACRPSWATMNLTTTCEITNALGTCLGTRTCGVEGLTGCNGAPPAAETCDGVDNDCDGQTDELDGGTCMIDNEFGSCPGTPSCGPGGQELCEGEGAKPEACNAQDDDCDGETDEDTCDDGIPCTTDLCTPDGTCVNSLAAGWCLIDGACYAANAPNPADPCEQCLPATATKAWSDANGLGCNDGDPCTWQDTCVAGVCSGTPYACNDGLDCTTDVCDGDGGCLAQVVSGFCLIDGACQPDGATKPGEPCFVCQADTSPKSWYPNDGGSCDDGDACTQGDTCQGITCVGTSYDCDDGDACTIDACTGDGGCTHTQAPSTCVIAGTCYAAGTPKPDDPCLACDPTVSGSQWSPVAQGSSCDDGQPCTSDDKCSGGICQGTPYTCFDGLACTTDTCNGDGTCTYTPEPGKCAIDGGCFDDGEARPGNTCQTCQAALNPTGWIAKAPGTSCDDGQSCTFNDTCDASGQCVGQGQDCSDGKWCTQDDCDGQGGCVHTPAGGCLINGTCYQPGALNPANPCQECNPNQSGTAWSPSSGAACDDGDLCTYNDQCQSGTCVGTPHPCNDSLSCTSDLCDGQGGCTFTTNPGKCVIGGTCYSTGNTNPSNTCQICNATLDDAGWSANNGASCSDGNTCTQNDTCSGTTCVGSPILDGYEPNDSSSAAPNLGTVKDNMNWSDAKSFTASLYASGDEDWYKYRDEGTTLGDMEPRVELTNVPSGSNYKLCAFHVCDNGNAPDPKCNSGSLTTYGGMTGCCSDSGGYGGSETVDYDPKCGGLFSSATGTVYIRVLRTSGSWTCSSYSVKWGDI